MRWRPVGLLLTVILLGASAAPAGVLDYEFGGLGDVNAVSAMLRRVLKLKHGAPFPLKLEMVKTCAEGTRPNTSESNLCFELVQSSDYAGKSQTTVRGTSAIDIAYGAAYYFREYCSMSFAWPRSGGNQVTPPVSVGNTSVAWPTIGNTSVVRWRTRDISYGFNVCTFSYSQAWYDFNGTVSDGSENWEQILDWMALSGINLALAYTGQEEIYRKVYNQFGVNDTLFTEWSNGPAHLTWSRGQSMHNVGGPLPLSWMKGQWKLQRHILKRMRELGMTPILPAFQGNVPPAMKSLFPKANISLQKAHWGGGAAAWLDATDPLFQKIGDALMKELVTDFGIDKDGDGMGDVTEHWYEADGYFAAGDPPWLASTSLAAGDEAKPSWPQQAGGSRPYSDQDAFADAYAHASKAYMAMNATDPHAIWMYQGWILGDNAHDLQVMKGYRAAVPHGRLVVSDMFAEWAPISGMLAEANVPYLFGTLQNFGGTLFLGMSIVPLNNGAPEDPTAVPSIFDTFANRSGGVGVGAFPEGIDQNPAYYTYLFDAPWLSAPVPDLDRWWTRYAQQRYGGASASAEAAWRALGRSVYGIDERKNATEGGFWREKAKGGLISAPLMQDESDEPSHSWYNLSDVLFAWESLVVGAEELQSSVSDTLRYDLANAGREVLDRVANARAILLNAAATSATAIAAADAVIETQMDADRLLCTDASLSMSSWVAAASAIGREDGLTDFYNRMARAQVTTWLPSCRNASEFADGVCSIHEGNKKPPLEDYANKAWGGLVAHYYAGRVRCYANQWKVDPVATAIDVTAYYACIDGLARDFQQDVNSSAYPLCQAPEGDVLHISRALIAKYRDEVWVISQNASVGNRKAVQLVV